MIKRITYTLSLVFYVTFTMAQQFKEVSEQAGLDHLFDMGDVIYGGGVAVLDYDNDGWEDIYLTGGMLPDALYRNNGNKTFTNVFVGSGLEITGEFHTQGVISGDINNDSFTDLFIYTRAPASDLSIYAHDLLFLNNGDGTFSNVTAEWNLDQIARFSTAASFGDVNLDGKLDLFVGTYISDPFYDIFEPDGSNAPTLKGEQDMLYINAGNRFVESSKNYGINVPGCALGSVFTDFDNDHDMDLYVVNDFGNTGLPPNLLYRNEIDKGEDKFTEIGYEAGVDIGMNAMGVAHGDYNNDGHLDYFVTNMGPDFLLKNNGDGTFEDATVPAGLVTISVPYGERSYLAVSWGTVFFDFDHDGYLDLFVVNGDLSPPALPNPNVLYRNMGDGTFEDVTQERGLGDHHVGRGAAILDYDRDGDMDLVVVNQKYPPDVSTDENPNILFYENQLNNDYRFLKVRLKGKFTNPQAYGAHIVIKEGFEVMMREIEGGSSHLSQNSSIAHFGLRDISNIDLMEIYWPGGKRQVMENVSTNRLITIEENEEDTPVVTSIADNLSQANPMIYPNPTKGQIYIDNSIAYPLQLYDLKGKMVAVLKEETNDQYTIPETIKDGIYLISNRNNFKQLIILKRK